MKRSKIMVATEYCFNLMLNVLPVIFWLCLIYSFDELMGASVTVLAMIIHEAGHLAFVFLITGKIKIPKGNLNGLRIAENKMATYTHQILLYSSGATSNLIAALIMISAGGLSSDYGEIFIAINLATAISNLMPLEGYDGYRILISTIEYFNLGYWSYAVLEIVSFTFIFIMSIISLFLVYTFGNGYWILGIFLGATINKLQKWHNYKNLRI